MIALVDSYVDISYLNNICNYVNFVLSLMHVAFVLKSTGVLLEYSIAPRSTVCALT